ncbi:MAG: hypothetical protein AAF125_21790 [Chloroflexota bacterium]
MELKKMLIAGTAAGLLVMGVAVGAQDDEPTTDTDATAEVTEGREGRFGGRDGRFGFGGRDGRFGNRDFNVDREAFEATLTTYTGLTADELREALQAEDVTLATLIVDNGETVEAFVSEITAPVFEQIDAAVEAGDLEAERADEMKTRLSDGLTERLESGRGFGRDGGPRGERGFRGARGVLNSDLMESYTGLTGEEVRDALRDGQTVAELIEANGGDVDAFIAEAVTTAEATIQERAAERTANLETIITALVNGERPEITPTE